MGNVIVKDLPCEMTPAERMVKAANMARLHGAICKLEEAKKEAAAELQQTITSKKRELGLLAREVETGLETRPVECTEHSRFSDKLVDLRRIDTGAVVMTRAMTEQERQPGLPFARGGRGGDDDDDNAVH